MGEYIHMFTCTCGCICAFRDRFDDCFPVYDYNLSPLILCKPCKFGYLPWRDMCDLHSGYQADSIFFCRLSDRLCHLYYLRDIRPVGMIRYSDGSVPENPGPPDQFCGDQFAVRMNCVRVKIVHAAYFLPASMSATFFIRISLEPFHDTMILPPFSVQWPGCLLSSVLALSPNFFAAL